MVPKIIINTTLLATATFFINAMAQSATPYSLKEFLLSFEKSGIASKISKSIAEQAASKTVSTKAALESWTAIIESEVGTTPADESKIAFGVSRRFTIGVEDSQIDRRFAKEGQADLIAQSMDIRNQELQIANLYIKLRLQKMLYETADMTLKSLKPIVENIQGAAKRGSIGYLASMRAALLLSEITANLDASELGFRSLAKVSREIVGIPLSDNPYLATFEPLPTEILSKDIQIRDFPIYRENLLRQEALSSEASILSSQREIGASVSLSKETKSLATSVMLSIDVPIMTGSIVSSQARQLHASSSLLSASADLIVAKVNLQFKLLMADLIASQERIKRLEARQKEIKQLAENARRGFKRGQAEAEAVTESISKLYEVSVQKHAEVAQYEVFLAEMWTLTGEFPNAK